MESEASLPKRLFAADFKADAKLAQFSIEMRNIVGAMQEQTQAVAKHNVRILSGFHDAPPALERGIWSFFADFTEADIDPETLASELRSRPSVLSVRYQSQDDGFITDSLHFPTLLGSERAIIVRLAVLRAMIDRVNAIFGAESEPANVILRQIGEAGGVREFESIKDVTGVEFVRKNVARAFNLYTALGYGVSNLTALDFEKKTAEIRVKDGFECARFGNPSSKPRSHFIRGLIAGWFSRLFESRINAVEIQCVAKGDPECVFQVQPVKT
jgi:predicted hydrocarbon binding protein